MECNICGGTEFGVFKNRGRIQCTKCGSIERTRLLKMYLDKFAGLRGGIRVLHFAPERPLFKAIAKTVGDGYHIRDINIRRYASLSLGVVSIEQFDLCTDVVALPSNHYDLILHNHVLEHLPCNITAVLWHLHRALSPTGLHMFSIPIVPGRYEESLLEMSPEAREKRFHHPEHYRNFGRDDLPHTIGMVFDIEAQLQASPVDMFGEETFVRYNIPRSRWSRFSGATPFVLKKADLKLQ